jgi:hypothetical protein
MICWRTGSVNYQPLKEARDSEGILFLNERSLNVIENKGHCGKLGNEA